MIQKEGLSSEDRLLQHQTHSGPVMAELESWSRKQLDENLVEPNSGLGKALKYLLKHWTKLTSPALCRVINLPSLSLTVRL